MIVPSLGALVLGGWSFGIAAYGDFIEGNGLFAEAVEFFHTCFFLFGQRASFWMVLGWACFFTGLVLLYRSLDKPLFPGARVLGAVLACVPLAILALVPFFLEYHGP